MRNFASSKSMTGGRIYAHSPREVLTDEEAPPIEPVDESGGAEFDKLVRVCPAALCKRDEEGRKGFDYAGCLECCACRVICGDAIVKKGAYPGPTIASSAASAQPPVRFCERMGWGRSLPRPVFVFWRVGA